MSAIARASASGHLPPREVVSIPNTLQKVVGKIGLRHTLCGVIALANLAISRSFQQSAVTFVISQIAFSFLQSRIQKDTAKPREDLGSLQVKNQKILESLSASALAGNDQDLSDIADLFFYAILDRNYKAFLTGPLPSQVPSLLEKLKHPCSQLQAKMELAQKNSDDACVSKLKEEILWWKLFSHLFYLRKEIREGHTQEARDLLRGIQNKQFPESSLSQDSAMEIKVLAFCEFLQQLIEKKPEALAIKTQLEEVLSRRGIDPRFILNKDF